VDDDPSGIGTYAQAGAQFGLGISWMMLITYPLMASIRCVPTRAGERLPLVVTCRRIAIKHRIETPQGHFPEILDTLGVRTHAIKPTGNPVRHSIQYRPPISCRRQSRLKGSNGASL
jgi:hypothetical protein